MITQFITVDSPNIVIMTILSYPFYKWSLVLSAIKGHSKIYSFLMFGITPKCHNNLDIWEEVYGKVVIRANM